MNNCSNCGRKPGSPECRMCVTMERDFYDDQLFMPSPTQWISPIEQTIKKKEDLINHPKHYKTESGLETIDVIEAFTDGLKGIEATDTGNIIKYICRWKKKNGLQDLKKAQWYLNHLINKVEEKEKKNEKTINV